MGLVLALGDADADGILNRKTDRHAELEGILIYMGGKDHRLVAGCYRTAAPTCWRVTWCSGVLGTVLDEACGRGTGDGTNVQDRDGMLRHGGSESYNDVERPAQSSRSPGTWGVAVEPSQRYSARARVSAENKRWTLACHEGSTSHQ